MTLLPGIEYLLLTSREGLGFAAKGNGFPFRDIAQFVFPGSVSQWSPLYIGIPALFFVAVALMPFRPRQSRFWLRSSPQSASCTAWAKTAPSITRATIFIPGLRFFRGQERAALLVANSLAVLAGLGIAALANWPIRLSGSAPWRIWRLLCRAD